MDTERLAQLRDLADSLAECRSFLAASSRDLKDLLAYVDQLVGERDRARDLAVRSGVFEDGGGKVHALTPEEF